MAFGVASQGLDDGLPMEEWLRRRNGQLGGDSGFDGEEAGDGAAGASGPLLPMPFSAPDPDAGPWAEMVAQNQALQAKNDPLAGDAPGVGAPLDSLSEQLRRAQMTNADWQAARSRQVVRQYDPSPPAGGAAPLGAGSKIYRLDQLDAARRQAEGPGDGTPYDQFAPQAVDKAVRDPAGAPASPVQGAYTPSMADAAKRARALENGAAAVGGLISQGEGTGGSGGYDKVFGQGWKKNFWYPPGTKPPSQLTVDEWIALGPQLRRANGSGAMGKYEIMADTLKGVHEAPGLKKQLRLTGNEIMSEGLQDRMMRELLNGAGYDKFLAGAVDAATVQKNLADIWSSLPVDGRGLTRSGGRSPIESQQLQDALKAAQTEINRQIDAGSPPALVGGWREDPPPAHR